MGYRNSHLAKGQDYHDTFETIPHRKMMWNCERKILRRILNRFLRGKPIEHLDFACGTGRIIGFLQKLSNHAVGIDISESMIDVARERVQAEFIAADLTHENVLGVRTFDIVTAFRFFPNAEPSLRNEVLSALIPHIKDDGILVFNNHVNPRSLIRGIARLACRGSHNGMTYKDVHDLVAKHNLKIVATYPLGMLPLSERRMPVWLGWLWRFELLFSHLPWLAPIAHDTIYVLVKKSK